MITSTTQHGLEEKVVVISEPLSNHIYSSSWLPMITFIHRTKFLWFHIFSPPMIHKYILKLVQCNTLEFVT